VLHGEFWCSHEWLSFFFRKHLKVLDSAWQINMMVQPGFFIYDNGPSPRWDGRRIRKLERKYGYGMIKIKSRGGESIEQMLKRFKKMCEKEGLIKDVKRKSYYEKPSEQRRRRRRKSAKRAVAGVV